MKHQLLCTSAIALCVAASSAAAQEWDVKVGGFFTAESYMADSGELMEDKELGGLELKTDAELKVSPSITLDNGLSIAGTLEWELTGKENADHTFMTVSGPGLGRVLIGQTTGAGLKTTVGAPNVTHGGFNEWFPGEGDLKKPASGGATGSRAGTDGYVFGQIAGTALDAGDYQIGAYGAARLAYFSPEFNGLSLGISYAPDGATQDGNNEHRDANKEDLATNIIDMGVGFSQAFGDANVSFSAAYGMANVEARRAKADANDASDRSGSLNNWSVGGKVTFGAITVGGTIAGNNELGDYENPMYTGSGDDVRLVAGTDDTDTDHTGMNFGISYDAPGPWAFSATMSTGTSTWKENMENGTGASRKADTMVEKEVDRTAFTVGAAQSLGSGVKWSIWYNSAERGNASASVFGSSLGISF